MHDKYLMKINMFSVFSFSYHKWDGYFEQFLTIFSGKIKINLRNFETDLIFQDSLISLGNVHCLFK